MATATYLLGNGHDIRTILRLLGHSDVQTTVIYELSHNYDVSIAARLGHLLTKITRKPIRTKQDSAPHADLASKCCRVKWEHRT